jgi:DNA invertase Pin-like site-specific DNA recombinase
MKSAPKFFLYVRKSTDEANRQVTSLDAQRRELREFIKRERLSVVEEIEESRTAKEPGRPLFNSVLARIEQGEADGLLCWDIDRLYRNPVDEGRVRWMLQRGVIKSIRTPTRSYSPADAGLLIAVEGGRATDFIIHHKRDVARGVKEKLLRGEWPGGRPEGYLYDHDRRNIVPDPKSAKFIQQIFEEFSTGGHSLQWVSERFAERGIVRGKSGKPWSKSQTQRFLTNDLYIGIMVWNGEPFEGKYKPLITHELFRKVGEVLKNRSRPRHTRKGHHFAFRGLFHCSCGSMITAQWGKGHGGLYRYYRCSKKDGVCDERYLQEKAVTEQCLEKIRSLAISSEEASLLRTLTEETLTRNGKAIETANAEVITNLASVQAKLNKLTRAYLDDLIDEEDFRAAKANLVTEKTSLKHEKTRLQRTGTTSWFEPMMGLINTLELAGKAEEAKSPDEIAPLVQRTGLNLLISRKKVSFDLAPPFDFASEFLAETRVSFNSRPVPQVDTLGTRTIWCRLHDHFLTCVQPSVCPIESSEFPSV